MDRNGVQHNVRVMWQRRWVRVLVFFSFWTFLAFFFGIRMVLSYAYAGYGVNWRFPMLLSLTEVYGWAVLFPLIYLLARKFRFEGGWWWRDVPVHMVAGLGLALIKANVDRALIPWVTGEARYSVRVLDETHSNLLTYWILVGLLLGGEYYRRYREREVKASQLEAQLAQARLEALRMQLHPHFLFNTLNGISALMHRDVEAADRMLARLSELLRLTLESGDAQEVSLKQELDFLSRYLEIEKTRFGDRLTVEMRIEPETLDAQVPNLILQPLVENAIRHGIAPQAAPGRIELRAERRDGRLRLEVFDNGKGMTEEKLKSLQEGVGLSNTRARLQQLYGESCRFKLENGTGAGLRVTVEIPFRTEARSDS